MANSPAEPQSRREAALWPKVRLGEICEIYDCPHTTAPDEGEGYPLVRTPNVGRGRLIFDKMHRVSRAVYDRRNKRAVPKAGDIILSMYATRSLRDAYRKFRANLNNGREIVNSCF